MPSLDRAHLFGIVGLPARRDGAGLNRQSKNVMFAPTEKSETARAKRSLVPVSFAVFAFGIAFIIPFLARQPKEVSAAVYATYVAVMALAAGVVFLKRNRRNMAIGAACTSTAFTAIFVFYAYLAYIAPR